LAKYNAKTCPRAAEAIAFISGRIGSSFVSAVIRGAEEKLKSYGENRYIFLHHPAGDRETGTDDAVREIIEASRAKAVIILSLMPSLKSRKKLEKAGIRQVYVERRVAGAHFVCVDNRLGGEKVAGLFHEKGRKRIAVIADPQSAIKGMASYERLEGFKKLLAKRKIRLLPENIVFAKYHTIEDGRSAFERLEKRLGQIDAVFSVAGDLCAIGFMLEAKSNGINVPEDIAIAGYDDIEMAAAVEPALTTVRQPIDGMGAMAVELAHMALTDKLKKPVNNVIDPELVIRGSV